MNGQVQRTTQCNSDWTLVGTHDKGDDSIHDAFHSASIEWTLNTK